MPEGPSILILKEAAQPFKGKKVLSYSGNNNARLPELTGEVVTDFRSFGKHFLICFKTYTVRIHLLLFGSYLINQRKEAPLHLRLVFDNGEINFYTCSVKLIEKDLEEVYDWTADVMNEKWSAAKARKKLQDAPGMLVCDALMDQDIFAGVGNIIKNEVLFRIKVHPESKIGALPAAKLDALLKETVTYSFEFLEWKKASVLKQHWLAYSRDMCPRDHVLFHKRDTGKLRRKSYYCGTCQVLYG